MEFYIFSKSNAIPLPPIATDTEEPLFLNPDGVRTRFPIGWGGGEDKLKIF